MKTFDEVLKELAESVKTTPNGKLKKTWSKTDFDTLAKAFLNTPEYEMKIASIKNGVMTEKTYLPVTEFRKSLVKLAVSTGMDKQDAEVFMTVPFKDVEGFYETITELIFQYANAGKKFDFPTKADFTGSFTISEVGPTEKIYKSIKKPGDDTPQTEVTVKTKKHKKLESKSKAPKWCKDKIK